VAFRHYLEFDRNPIDNSDVGERPLAVVPERHGDRDLVVPPGGGLAHRPCQAERDRRGGAHPEIAGVCHEYAPNGPDEQE
jgi:hypothetical protein